MNTTRQNKHILIIDDEVDILGILEMILENPNTKISKACCAEEGLEIINNTPSINLVISDIRMPGKYDGVELFEILKRKFPFLPVILMTGESNFTREKALTCGVAGYLEKPIDFSRLQFLIDSSLRYFPNPIRQYIRFRGHLPTKILIEGCNQSIAGVTKNISLGGLLLETESYQPAGSRLQFQIECPPNILTNPISGKGRIAWSAKRSEKVEMGIEFSYITHNHQILINNLIEHISR